MCSSTHTWCTSTEQIMLLPHKTFSILHLFNTIRLQLGADSRERSSLWRGDVCYYHNHAASFTLCRHFRGSLNRRKQLQCIHPLEVSQKPLQKKHLSCRTRWKRERKDVEKRSGRPEILNVDINSIEPHRHTDH